MSHVVGYTTQFERTHTTPHLTSHDMISHHSIISSVYLRPEHAHTQSSHLAPLHPHTQTLHGATSTCQPINQPVSNSMGAHGGGEIQHGHAFQGSDKTLYIYTHTLYSHIHARTHTQASRRRTRKRRWPRSSRKHCGRGTRAGRCWRCCRRKRKRR